MPSAALRFKPAADVLAQFGGQGVKAPGGKATVVWVSNGTTISPVTVTVGASDSTQTEIVNAPFAEGALVVPARVLDGRRDGRAGTRDQWQSAHARRARRSRRPSVGPPPIGGSYRSAAEQSTIATSAARWPRGFMNDILILFPGERTNAW